MSLLASLGMSALESLTGGLISGGVGSLFQGSQTDEQKRLMALSQQYNERNMELQYGYNKRLMEQGQRYQDKLNANQGLTTVGSLRRAGLNVNSALGGGYNGAVVNSGPDASVSGGSAPSGSAPGLPSLDLSSVMNNALAGQQLELVKNQADLAKANAEKARGDNLRADEMLALQKKNIDSIVALNEFDLQKLKPQQAELYSKQIEDFNKQWEALDANIKLTLANKDLSEKHAQLLQKEIDTYLQKLFAELQVYKSQVQANMASANVSNTQSEVNKANVGLVNEQTKTQRQQTQKVAYDAFVSKIKGYSDKLHYNIEKALGKDYYTNKEVLETVVSNTTQVLNAGANVIGSYGQFIGGVGNLIPKVGM